MQKGIKCASLFIHALGISTTNSGTMGYAICLRLELKSEPSKGNKVLIKFDDSRMGKEGRLIDFSVLYHHCPFPELFQKFEDNFSFHPHKSPTLNLHNAREKDTSTS